MDPILRRILNEAGEDSLFEILAERMSPTDLQSLLLGVFRARAKAQSPAQVLAQYQSNRFVTPGRVDPRILTALDGLAFSLLPPGTEPLTLSPVCPLGTNSVVATVDQNKIMATARNGEVVADGTNVLALECACRRRKYFASDSRSKKKVRLAASHRHLRTQVFERPEWTPHFRVFCMASGGRDEGSSRFELQMMLEQLSFYLRFLEGCNSLGLTVQRPRVSLATWRGPVVKNLMQQNLVSPLVEAHPQAIFRWEEERERGRNYYRFGGFIIEAQNASGHYFELCDGGFTNWTQQYLSNQKERLLISGMGFEVLASCFPGTGDGSSENR